MDGEIKKDRFIRRNADADLLLSANYGTPSGAMEAGAEAGIESEAAESAAPPEGAVSRAQEAEAALARGEKQRDPEKEFMANAVRRAYDQELEALAGLALFRSYMSQMGRNGGKGGILPPPSKEELNERLRRILDDPDDAHRR